MGRAAVNAAAARRKTAHAIAATAASLHSLKKTPDRIRAPLPPPPEANWSDADVLSASYFYEQAKGKRVTPTFRVRVGC
jgi:hypothetical protein